jgi:putative membrane protein insertion efficiency factor
MRALVALPARIALLLVRGYQRFVSPMLPPACRFTPSCSHYACACLADHGFVRGSWLTLRRLARCHPWHPGGYDPPPPAVDVDRHAGALGFDMPRTTPVPSHDSRESSR